MQDCRISLCLVSLMLNVPVNNFSMLGRSHSFLGITSIFGGMGRGLICVAQGHNTTTQVGLKPPTSGSGIRGVNHQATAPPHFTLCFQLAVRDFQLNTLRFQSENLLETQLDNFEKLNYIGSRFLIRQITLKYNGGYLVCLGTRLRSNQSERVADFFLALNITLVLSLVASPISI